ncbi:MAG: hypothetical protein ACE5OZ_24905 [Candidatus Heimdallarchaeota archaeon]
MLELVLQGEILTPVITKFPKTTTYNFLGCKLTILKPRRRYIGKLTVGQPMFPYVYEGHLGQFEVRYRCASRAKAEQKLTKLLNVEALGLFTSEGLGVVDWLRGSLKKLKTTKTFTKWTRKVRIRKGLPHTLPEEVQRLIQLALLHDFYNTSSHRSKIYVEPEIADEELLRICRSHHDKSKEESVVFLQKYDRWAASLTRPSYKSPRPDRYNWRAKKKIDFPVLAQQLIDANTKGVWALYNFIYANKELDFLNESLEHGHTSLKRHILIMSNIIVHDFVQNRIELAAHQKAA